VFAVAAAAALDSYGSLNTHRQRDSTNPVIVVVVVVVVVVVCRQRDRSSATADTVWSGRVGSGPCPNSTTRTQRTPMGVRAPQWLLVVLLVVAVIFVFFSRNYRVKISEVRRIRAGLPRVRGLCLVGSGPVRSV